LGLGLGTSGGGLGGARGVNTAIQTNRQNDRRAQYVTRVDFGPAAAIASSTEVATTVEHTLAAVVPNGISVAVEGSTAVLRGSVPSVQDRKLAEQMALLEPGVRSVRNELVVQNNSVGKP
jgi:osmotically-inducible protein OsmY